MGVDIQQRGTYLAQQFSKGLLRIETLANHLGVDEMADQRLDFRTAAVGKRRTDAQVPLTAVAPKQHGKRADQHVEQRAMGLSGQCIKTAQGAAIDCRAEGRPSVTLHGRAWSVISILFALLLTAISTVIGVCAGAIQGYYGGMTDLIGQRIQEIWSGLPVLYLLIILSGFVSPSFWWLLGIMALFSWLSLVDVVRAEFLRGRNLEYVKAARALGLTDAALMWRHILPNAMTSTLTYLPFIITGAIATLTALDFLGFGMPAGSASLGELIGEAKRNLQAPWLGLTAFVALALILSLLVFIGEACRDAFDPRS